MASVTRSTANWRLFGGSAILAAAILWVLALATGLVWLQALAYIVLAAGLVIVAFGQTGGNGAVGKDVLGKVALVVFAAGFVILALSLLVDIPAVVIAFAAIFIIVGGLVSAWRIDRKGVAKGASSWILFLPAVVGAIWAAGFLSATFATTPWIEYVLAILFGVTGALYLLNDRKIG